MPSQSDCQLASRAVAVARQADIARIRELREVEEAGLAIIERDSESDSNSDGEDESDLEISDDDEAR